MAELGVHEPTKLLTVHPRCLVTTVWHRALNQLRELSRGADKHGSCGQGIGDTRHYWLRYGHDAIFAADLRRLPVLREKLELLRQRVLLELQGLIDRVAEDSLRELDLWDLNTEAVARHLSEVAQQGVAVSSTIPECATTIFEGAQGVLLDEYRGFHPYTTWSTVTAHHAWELIGQMNVEAVAVLGITRAYTTRHGQGPLPTYSPELTARLRDVGNPWNQWQGSLRCGWLDLPLLRYAAAVAGPFDGLVVNHLDQLTDGECVVCDAYKDMSLQPAPAPNLSWQSRLTEQLAHAAPVLSPVRTDGILDAVNAIAPVVLTGVGPTHEDRRFVDLRFRNRKARGNKRRSEKP